ncbi:hypothetical protein [Pyxidicoccus xibeiensis]|uniref:hypothetical protein n=1 Tax=Pyxidicoccus xibeiensis TaxID=2906759 RepID=UPI0020A75E0F|nr:hypothetical protein [Pyxidicoccus xibeiensis]MCP3139520.1 hypothetical protein [Pyxidicoccus xibeiensis]
MRTRQESTRQGQWSRGLLGWTAGVVGMLLAGGLARRRHSRAHPQEPATAPTLMAVTEPEEELESIADQRREARRRRLAALELRAATVAEAPAREVPRQTEPRLRRGPSGREQPWHEALASTVG